MNNINFSMDGMSLDGTCWHNPKTGDSFMIRNNYFEDNRMVILTSDGRRFDMDKMKDYIQTKTLVPKTSPVQDKPNLSDLPPEVANLIGDSGPEEDIGDYMDPEDLAMIQGLDAPVGDPCNKGLKQDGLQLPSKPSPINTNIDIIDRALSKTKTPDWVLTMKWPKFPQKELDMLLTVMDVPMDDIEEYYLRHIREEFDEFINNLKNQIGDYIEKKIKGDEQETTTKKSTKRSK